MPDFIVRPASQEPRYLIVETKGHDERLDDKRTAAERWVRAVNADGRYGHWRYLLLRDRERIAEEIESAKGLRLISKREFRFVLAWLTTLLFLERSCKLGGAGDHSGHRRRGKSLRRENMVGRIPGQLS